MGTVDIDRYIARNEPTWLRLDQLTREAQKGVAKLEPAELEELVQLYQRTSAHLSYIRTHLREPTLISRLTRLVATANGVIYGKRTRSFATVGRFLSLTYPGAVYHCRRAIGVAAIAFFAPALILGIWLSVDPAALDRSAPIAMRKEYVEDRFEQYYSDQPSAVFFTSVTTNNIRVSFVALALGAVSGGIGAIWLLVSNGVPLGVISAWMVSEGDLPRFFGFIIPHGTLELSAIVIAGGAGIRLGWSSLVPGDRTRADAFRDEGQRTISIIIGLMTMFLLAGLIEGFITGSGLPAGFRAGFGALLGIIYIAFLVTQGRAAASQGITGLLGEQARTWDDEPPRFSDPLTTSVPGRLA
jgi:uncharacterized membrane protein SpoIIM required for sporulation